MYLYIFVIILQYNIIWCLLNIRVIIITWLFCDTNAYIKYYFSSFETNTSIFEWECTNPSEFVCTINIYAYTSFIFTTMRKGTRVSVFITSFCDFNNTCCLIYSFIYSNNVSATELEYVFEIGFCFLFSWKVHGSLYNIHKDQDYFLLYLYVNYFIKKIINI